MSPTEKQDPPPYPLDPPQNDTMLILHSKKNIVSVTSHDSLSILHSIGEKYSNSHTTQHTIGEKYSIHDITSYNAHITLHRREIFCPSNHTIHTIEKRNILSITSQIFLRFASRAWPNGRPLGRCLGLGRRLGRCDKHGAATAAAGSGRGRGNHQMLRRA